MKRLCLALALLAAAGTLPAPAGAGERYGTPSAAWSTGQLEDVLGELGRDYGPEPGKGSAQVPSRGPAVKSRAPAYNKGGRRDKAALRRLARRIASAHGISPTLYENIVAWESNYVPAEGAAGEQGIAQVMPGTAAPYYRAGKLSGNLAEHETSLTAGVLNLSDLKRLIGEEEKAYMRRHRLSEAHLLMAGYNMGWGSVRKVVRSDSSLTPRMQSYIRNVYRTYKKQKKARD